MHACFTTINVFGGSEVRAEEAGGNGGKAGTYSVGVAEGANDFDLMKNGVCHIELHKLFPHAHQHNFSAGIAAAERGL